MRRELARAKSALAKQKLSLAIVASDKNNSQISLVKQKLVEERDYFSGWDVADNELSMLEI